MNRDKFLAIFLMLTMLVCCNCTEKADGRCPLCGREVCICDEFGKNDNGDNDQDDTDDEYNIIGSGFLYAAGGRIMTPAGKEVKLFGVNFQTPLSWEYGRLSRVGIAKTTKALNAVTDNNIADVALLGANLLRCHLTPADFTDANGNLVETPFLEALDYMIYVAGKNNIYVSLALLNHMGQSGGGTAWIGRDRSTWIHDADVVACEKRYISQLVSRVNKYSGVTYAETENIAYFELINEPSMFSYKEIAGSSGAAAYTAWLSKEKLADNAANYALYREQLVETYINDMCTLLDDNGDHHLVCWGLNWHRYRNGNQDIFKGVASSKADIVAFCNYPGQDLVAQNYWDYQYDFTNNDFAPWFSQFYSDIDGYGWALSPQFANKAKVVYEFESFFNMCAYLYPIQAEYFCSLGAQTAAMWTYTFSELAPYYGGSHFLSLTCTPSKAASFLVAREIMRNNELKVKLPENINEHKTATYAISKSHNGAVYSSSTKFYHSAAIDDNWNPLPPKSTVKHIAGYGSCPIVAYSGTGLYFVDIVDDKMYINLMPNVNVVGNQFKSPDYSTIVTELDYSAMNTLSITLEDWAARQSTLYRIDNGEKTDMGSVSGTSNLRLRAGQYVVEPK